MKDSDFIIGVVGLGYVGLPLAHLLAERFEVNGYDCNKEKIKLFNNGIDPTNEIGDEIKSTKIRFYDNPSVLKSCNFIIVSVPTPINKDSTPDIKPIVSATETVARNLSKGTIISYESTVWPGLTEEVCLPLIENVSRLKFGKDFKLAYSPERVNPGDKIHTIDKVVKIVSGSDEEALEKASYVYGSITSIYKAPNIKTAEAAKVIENVQRDLNIGLMNELSKIFRLMDIDTKEVIEAAGTKWNFHKYSPGLVGGHCIGVDPYYLTFKAQQLGYVPQIILAARGLNESMAEYVKDLVIKELAECDKPLNKANVYVLGLTFKENVNDLRNSKIKDLINSLKEYKVNVLGYDPYVSEQELKHEGFNIPLLNPESAKGLDAIILGSPHNILIEKLTPEYLKKVMEKPVLVDIKGAIDKKLMENEGIRYVRL